MPTMTVLARKPGADHREVLILPLSYGRRVVRSDADVYGLADELGVIHQLIAWEGGHFADERLLVAS